MGETGKYDSRELREEIDNLRAYPRDRQLLGHMGDTARVITGYMLVMTAALTAIGGLALASVV